MTEQRKKEQLRELPIAVFDSGVGGVSVLRELVKILPNENYIYYGDSKNAPYGTKSLDEVRRLTGEHAQELFSLGVKGLVIACNTATSASVRLLREQYPQIPIVGIEPAVKPAANFKDHPTVLVLATPMTIREEKFRRLMGRYEDQAEIIPLPCPGLMEFIERGDLRGEDLRQYLMELLSDYRVNQVDAAVLGCTHYPFAREMIQEILGDKVQIFDGGEGTAREMKRRLAAEELLCSSDKKGQVEFCNSLPESERIELCHKLFYLH